MNSIKITSDIFSNFFSCIRLVNAILGDVKQIVQNSSDKATTLNDMLSEGLQALANEVVLVGHNDSTCQKLIREMKNIEFTVENRLVIDPAVSDRE